MRMLLPIICLLFSQSSFTQERAGLLYGSYNGINAVHINPAFSFNSTKKWSGQLIGGHIFGQSNYASVTNSNLFNLLKSDSEDILIRETIDEEVEGNYTKEILFNQAGPTNVDFKGEGTGPAFLMYLSKELIVGISTRARAIGTSYNMPAPLNYYAFDEVSPTDILKMNASDGSSAAFIELDLHAGMKITEDIHAGATLKFLRGYEAFTASNNVNFDFVKIEDHKFDMMNDGNFTIRHTSPESGDVTAKGFGLGMDLGVSLEEPWGQGGQLGIALLDLGLIKYDGVKKTYAFTSELELESIPYFDLVTAEEFDAQLAQDFTILDSSNTFSVILPTALSIQYRQHLNKHFSIAGHWTQRIKFAKNQLSRSNSINLTGVYERKYFSAFLPLSLYDYNELRVGAAVRLGVLTIGSDQVMSLIGESNFNGTDFYVSLQFFPFKNYIDKTYSKGLGAGKNVKWKW